MSDPLVLKAQKWVNETYKGKQGFFTVELTGKTGWDTVNALTRALQIELGISALSNNFGPTTERLFDMIAPTLKVNGSYSENVVKILQCALWCKGYDMYDQTYFGEFTTYTEGAIKQIRVDCGLAESLDDPGAVGNLSSMIMKAILNMQSFVRVSWGDHRVRDIQRKLNKNYYPYFGLLPCDGVYQRDTNQALIYGLQCEMGMPVGTANGFFGVGTTANCPTLSKTQGTVANIKLLQYSLYVNGEYTGLFDGRYSNDVETAVIKFRKFMKIGNQNSGIADMPVIKALLSTTGDTERSAKGFDASTIMDQAMINTVKSMGMSYAGRYLTGTVGVGSNRRPKNLTIKEATLLLENGISIIPIYQDNSAQLSDYSLAAGKIDGKLAFQRAFELGIPADQIIYFAVDVDTTLDQIESHIIPYFQGINEAHEEFSRSWDYFYMYQVGIYAPRNVCKILADKQLASPNCYVSNMSSGFSANLGYPQPKEWAFDQFYEPPYGVGTGAGHIYIDKVAVSERNTGTNVIRPEINQIKEVVRDFEFPALTNLLNSGTVSFGEEVTILHVPFVSKVTYRQNLGISPTQGDQIFRIVDGKIDAAFTEAINSNTDVIFAKNLLSGMESITARVKNGNISCSASLNDKGDLTYAITVNVIDKDIGAGKVSFSFTIKITLEKNFFTDYGLDHVLETVAIGVTVSVCAILLGSVALSSGALATAATIASYFLQFAF
ncbi:MULTISPECIES: glycoside hydrolase domain-containing protein [unclassified Enterococcus]|uniref:glycoside hydrolase domain-containing protein n=1 Tax=unclassified Enterococcus TaxID=2608891 RepID=UPI001CE0B405|nr:MULTISPECIES: glycoside hydrolase domain-containing protein [unclassified Enterococcus]MCA5014593.1 DUF1906 domain-containing protein [Enterococcus sp. S23]MCA5017846.1 DUF1906 domain-containing protein [Enterococcus sp. S22(2020)]